MIGKMSLTAEDVSKAPRLRNWFRPRSARPSEPSQRVGSPPYQPACAHRSASVTWPSPLSGHLTGFPKGIRGFFTWPRSIWPSEGVKRRWHFSLFGAGLKSPRPSKPDGQMPLQLPVPVWENSPKREIRSKIGHLNARARSSPAKCVGELRRSSKIWQILLESGQIGLGAAMVS